MTTVSSAISIVIFSHDRHALLKRSFDYYSQSDYPVIAVDSSDKKFAGDIPEGIQYLHTPKQLLGDKIFQALNSINTEYAILSADDDFLSFSALNEGYDFLEKNPDYISVQGHYIHFEQRNPAAYHWPSYLPTIGYDNNADDMAKRMENAFRAQHLYALFRTKDLITCIGSTLGLAVITNVELSTALVGNILGKNKVIPKFWMARSIERFSSYSLNPQSKTSSTTSKIINSGEAYLDQSDGQDFLQGIVRSLKQHGKVTGDVSGHVRAAFRGQDQFKKQARKKTLNSQLRQWAKIILPAFLQDVLKKMSAHSMRKQVKELPGFPWSDNEAHQEWARMMSVIAKHKDRLKGFIIKA